MLRRSWRAGAALGGLHVLLGVLILFAARDARRFEIWER